MSILQETLINAAPLIERGVNTPRDQVRFAVRGLVVAVKHTKEAAIEQYRSSFEELSTRRKIGATAWAGFLTAYTSADDVLAGTFFSAVSETAGLPAATASLSVVSASLAGGLALNQRSRIERAASEQGRSLTVRNRKLPTDLVSTFGIGAPATTLTYPKGTIPTKRRVTALSIAYGTGGQALTYAGAASAGNVIGLDPKVTVAALIGAVVAHRFAREAMDDPAAVLDTLGLQTQEKSAEIATVNGVAPLTAAI